MNNAAQNIITAKNAAAHSRGIIAELASTRRAFSAAEAADEAAGGGWRNRTRAIGALASAKARARRFSYDAIGSHPSFEEARRAICRAAILFGAF